jgi:hypothetical protein
MRDNVLSLSTGDAFETRNGYRSYLGAQAMAIATQPTTDRPSQLNSPWQSGVAELRDSELSESERRDVFEASDFELSPSPKSATRASQPYSASFDLDSYGIGAMIGGKYRLGDHAQCG